METMQKTPIATHRKTLDLTYSILRLCGCWVYDSDKLSLKLINVLVRFINWIIVTVILIALFIDMTQNINNIEAVSDVIGFFAPLIVTLLKSIILQVLQKDIYSLINSIHKPIERLRYSSDLGVLTTIRTAIYYQNFDFTLFSSVLSVVTIVIFFISSEVSDTGLAMRGYFPLNETASPIFEIIFFMQLWTVFINCVWVALFDLSLLGLIRWINVQIHILQYNYKNCDPSISKRDTLIMSNDTYLKIENYHFFKVPSKQFEINLFVPFKTSEMNIVDDSFILRFKTCMKHHQRIIKSIDNYNTIFSFVLCVQIITTNAVACFYLYETAWAIKHNKNYLKCFVMFGSVMVELFYYCIFGSQLITHAEMLRHSQYDSLWHNFLNRQVRDLMVNALVISLKPLEIKAGYFFIFSVETFVSVLQKSYSYFAILNSLME
ncbi:odorant receptor 82a-like [Microplitis mediator]|uniref:odorant receptor 82a-like n=1 Tax=Microplitis mediator TaxID=375433 RepID=UPI00255595C8|nr:odorant receptor 82a-like [Microplitis mediator]